jgi:hypothetical protein
MEKRTGKYNNLNRKLNKCIYIQRRNVRLDQERMIGKVLSRKEILDPPPMLLPVDSLVEEGCGAWPSES